MAGSYLHHGENLIDLAHDCSTTSMSWARVTWFPWDGDRISTCQARQILRTAINGNMHLGRNFVNVEFANCFLIVSATLKFPTKLQYVFEQDPPPPCEAKTQAIFSDHGLIRSQSFFLSWTQIGQI